jgi:hypothetical protein
MRLLPSPQKYQEFSALLQILEFDDGNRGPVKQTISNYLKEGIGYSMMQYSKVRSSILLMKVKSETPGAGVS